MKIAIIGGTGLIGVALSEELKSRGDEILLISRDLHSAKSKNKFAVKYFKWDYKTPTQLTEQINNYNTVINLTGAPIGGRRWSKSYMKEIRNSRIEITQLLAEALCGCENVPQTFISASAAGFYGDAGDKILTEDSPQGNDFLANICAEWENASGNVLKENIRLVNIRTGIVLSNEGGALSKMLLPYKLFLGGPLGNGNQWFPWIHVKDEVGAIIFTIDNDKINGPVNLTAPNPVKMKELSKSLGRALNRPSFFKVPKFALRMVAGKIAGSLVSSQRAVPKKLLDEGYKFNFAEVEDALKDLLK